MKRLNMHVLNQRVRGASLFALLLTAGNLFAVEDTNTFARAGLSIGARVGSDVQEYQIDGLVPFQMTDDSAWYFNLRGTLLEDLEQEVNAGISYRRLMPDQNVILGANLFYDSRWTENDEVFDQVGVGIERLSEWVDMRANYYYPLDDEKVLGESSQTDMTRAGSTLVSTTTRTRVYEEALQGFDAEIGGWLPPLSKTVPTALFVGYYDFSSDFAEDLSGFKVRVESRVHRNVTLDFEWFEDEALNRTDFFAGIRFAIPLGGKGLEAPGDRSFASRMNETIQRDFRIRTRASGPVVLDRTRQETRIRSASSSPTQASSSTTVSAPQTAAPTKSAANCSLDSNGDVICK